MIDFDALEFYFSKKQSWPVDFALEGVGAKQKALEPSKEYIPTVKYEKKKETVKPKPQPVKEVQTILPAPKRKEIKKDDFYKQWEKKYKALQAESLLAKDPFNKRVLFIIGENAPRDFAKRICEAINSRLMKATLITYSDKLASEILELEPTHLIYESSLGISSKLPSVAIDDLHAIRTNPEKKKNLWHTLKETLKS